MCYVAINGCPHHNTLCPRCDFNLDLHVMTVSPGHWVRTKWNITLICTHKRYCQNKNRKKWGGHTGLSSIGRWYLVTKRDLEMVSKLLCLMVKNIHDSQWTVSNIFGPYLMDLLLKFWDIYKKCSNSVNLWARKIFFF